MSGPRLHILVLSYFRPGNANVIRDFLFSFNAYSHHRYYYVFDGTTLDEHVDFSRFDVILFFWSLIEPDFSLPVRQRLRAAAALKVAFLQDEQGDVLLRNETMRQFGVNVIFTCVPQRDHATFYHRSRVDTLEATYTVLTGYVPTYLEGLPSPDGDRRDLDVSYRSRVVPFHLGDLGREKATIAERFQEICRTYDLRADISVRESDRIYGRAWPRFLRRSRCVLGTASGASVVDFRGDIREACDIYRAKFPNAPYDEVKARVFADVDGKVVIDTVSPRVFESAALHCTLVNHDGGYAGILEPERHYIRVKRDYSNVADVVDRIRDRAYCRTLAATAYRDLVASGQYSYRRFAEEFDQRLERHTRQTITVPAVSRFRFYARQHGLGRPCIIPRGPSFVLGPGTAIRLGIFVALVGRMPDGSVNSLASRFLTDPVRFVRMGHATCQMIVTTPLLRPFMHLFLRTPQARLKTTWRGLARDLLLIDVVRRARGGIAPCPSFGIDLEFDAPAGTLILKSTVLPGDQPRRDPLPADLDAALLAGHVRTIIWSYSPAANRAPLPRRPLRPIAVGLGGGVHRFDALSAVCAHAPDGRQALRAILSGEASPRERRQVIARGTSS